MKTRVNIQVIYPKINEVNNYKATINNNLYKVKTKKNDLAYHPEYRNMEVIRLLDTGNGIVVSVEDKIIELDYAEVEHLKVVLGLLNKYEDEAVALVTDK